MIKIAEEIIEEVDTIYLLLAYLVGLLTTFIVERARTRRQAAALRARHKRDRIKAQSKRRIKNLSKLTARISDLESAVKLGEESLKKIEESIKKIEERPARPARK